MRVFRLIALALATSFICQVQASTVSQLNPQDETLIEQREAFKLAKRAIFDGDLKKAQELREGVLKDYPLQIWLDYYTLKTASDPAVFYEVKKFIQSGKQKVLAERLLDQYVEIMAQDGRFSEVLELMPKIPYDPNLNLSSSQKGKVCRFYEANWALGKGSEPAVVFAQNVYLNLGVRPKACNGLMALFESQGYLSERLKLEKFERAFIEPRRPETVESLSHELESSSFAPLVKKALEYYKDPEKCLSMEVKTKLDRDVAVLALKRLARTDPNSVMGVLDVFEKRVEPTEVQKISIYQTLAMQNLGRLKPLESVKWVDQNLPAVAWSEPIKEQRLRRAVYFGQWEIVYELLDHVSTQLSSQINWQYWKGRSAIEIGKTKEGEEILKKVAQDRSFFGFLAAQTIGAPYAFNHLKFKDNGKLSAEVLADPAVQRFNELWAMDDANAIYEWREIARFSDEDVALSMADWALKQGNVRYAIESVTASKRWDALDYRFPIIYDEIYKENAKAQNVPVSFLYAISRQESMLNPVIKSPVGAVGLMQLMPGTAKMVSRQNSWKYGGISTLTNPEVNVRLGSAYIRDMLDRFDGNRILASAAYNAGPGRIDRWESHDGLKRDAAMYIESIPFTETRKYVQNVLLYDVIYNKLINGTESKLLTQKELSYRY